MKDLTGFIKYLISDFNKVIRNLITRDWPLLLKDLAATCRVWLCLSNELSLPTRYELITVNRVKKASREKIPGIVQPRNLTRNPYVLETGWFNFRSFLPIPRKMV